MCVDLYKVLLCVHDRGLFSVSHLMSVISFYIRGYDDGKCIVSLLCAALDVFVSLFDTYDSYAYIADRKNSSMVALAASMPALLFGAKVEPARSSHSYFVLSHSYFEVSHSYPIVSHPYFVVSP